MLAHTTHYISSAFVNILQGTVNMVHLFISISRKEAIKKKAADPSAKGTCTEYMRTLPSNVPLLYFVVTKVPEQRKRKRIQNMSSDEENGIYSHCIDKSFTRTSTEGLRAKLVYKDGAI